MSACTGKFHRELQLPGKYMKRDDWEFMERISRDLQARRAACEILGVKEPADREALKKAYRAVAAQFHPDKNQDDPQAHRKFLLVKCAYELLAEDKPCPALLEQINDFSGVPDDNKYKLDNPWGHFLWWRDKYFGTETKRAGTETGKNRTAGSAADKYNSRQKKNNKQKGTLNEGTSCI